MARKIREGLLLCCLVVGVAQADKSSLDITHLKDWEVHCFKGETDYSPALDELYGRVLKATSHGSASGYYHRRTVHLDETPVLKWAWKIDRFPDAADEAGSGKGEDFAARIYVGRMSMLGMWGAKCLVYVWSDQHRTGDEWKSPFSDHIHVIAVNGREYKPGQWQQVQRNVVADWGRVFGEHIDSVDLVAIMTDSDNSNSMAQAWYADLRLAPLQEGRIAALQEQATVER
ncbi:MAG: hypothetical protein B0D91_04855 [Oceanospirillales bacterium LUC14_002_19_P2]|nr:MAG: hypothetical protein B0D91_04855 [Oceanospirillales bacterium LUC14_002_19_P2]